MDCGDTVNDPSVGTATDLDVGVQWITSLISIPFNDIVTQLAAAGIVVD